jgi:methylated-DNA-[protein]-cysteine S-methyltransferase
LIDKKRKVLELLQKIPKGKVTTYAILGKKVGLHPRTVGVIMRGNDRPETYPCYKVVASDGRLGGYNQGSKEKIRQLENDGIVIKRGKIASLREKLHKFDNRGQKGLNDN